MSRHLDDGLLQTVSCLSLEKMHLLPALSSEPVTAHGPMLNSPYSAHGTPSPTTTWADRKPPTSLHLQAQRMGETSYLLQFYKENQQKGTSGDL